jgi:hypothetical protein
MKNPIKHGDTATSARHELLDRTRCAQFSDWIDAQLRELERRFSGFITRQSASHPHQPAAHLGRALRSRKSS